jgi:hypothetical protein
MLSRPLAYSPTRPLASSSYIGILAVATLATIAGCERPRPKFVTHPANTLQVPYERASGQTACLVASVTMAANYLVGKPQFSEPSVRSALKAAGRDESSVADVKQWLEEQGLHLVVLEGQSDAKPPLGMRFWLEKRGYPVICVINQQAGDARYNHAVVVTGVCSNNCTPPADIVYYLDPGKREPLQSVALAEFETAWQMGGRAMMVIVAPPPEAAKQDAPAPAATSVR